MSVTRGFVLYAADFDTGGGNDVFVDQIQQWNMSTEIEEMVLAADGAVDPSFVAVAKASPMIELVTTKVAAMLTASGLSGFRITEDTGDHGADFYLQQVADGGTRETGNNHLRLRMTQGLLVPRQISADNDSPATMSFECLASYDGTNAPFQIGVDQALPADTPAVSEIFVAGPVYINGTQVPGIQSITLDFGIQVISPTGDGDAYPTFQAIMNRRPTITFTTLDAEFMNVTDLTGVAQGATDSNVYLRKVAADGLRVADATAEHIKFTIDEGRISTRSINVGQGELAQVECQITPTYDGTNDVIAIAAASAIT